MIIYTITYRWDGEVGLLDRCYKTLEAAQDRCQKTAREWLPDQEGLDEPEWDEPSMTWEAAPNWFCVFTIDAIELEEFVEL